MKRGCVGCRRRRSFLSIPIFLALLTISAFQCAAVYIAQHSTTKVCNNAWKLCAAEPPPAPHRAILRRARRQVASSVHVESRATSTPTSVILISISRLKMLVNYLIRKPFSMFVSTLLFDVYSDISFSFLRAVAAIRCAALRCTRLCRNVFHRRGCPAISSSSVPKAL